MMGSVEPHSLGKRPLAKAVCTKMTKSLVLALVCPFLNLGSGYSQLDFRKPTATDAGCWRPRTYLCDMSLVCTWMRSPLLSRDSEKRGMLQAPQKTLSVGSRSYTSVWRTGGFGERGWTLTLDNTKRFKGQPGWGRASVHISIPSEDSQKKDKTWERQEVEIKNGEAYMAGAPRKDLGSQCQSYVGTWLPLLSPLFGLLCLLLCQDTTICTFSS